MIIKPHYKTSQNQLAPSLSLSRGLTNSSSAGQLPDFASSSENLRSPSLSSPSLMDWQGQKVAEQLLQIMQLVFAVVALATGYVMGSFQLMVLIYAAGVVLTALIIVPNWPFFNRHPLKWLEPSEADRHPKPQIAPKKKATKQK